MADTTLKSEYSRTWETLLEANSFHIEQLLNDEAAISRCAKALLPSMLTMWRLSCRTLRRRVASVLDADGFKGSCTRSEALVTHVNPNHGQEHLTYNGEVGVSP